MEKSTEKKKWFHKSSLKMNSEEYDKCHRWSLVSVHRSELNVYNITLVVHQKRLRTEK